MATLLDIVKKNATSRSVTIRIIDSTDGTPETGVVFNTAGIDLWYRREDAAVVSITEADLTTPALTDTWETGGFLHISHGEYRLDVPDAAFATGANHVDIGGTVTGMVVIGGRVRLVDYDPEDGVRFGLTALPNAAAQAANGLYTRGSGAGQINQAANGQVDTNVVYWLGQACVGVSVNGVPVVDLTHIHGSALTETAGQLAGRFVEFFNQASATFSVATALSSFKATGFSTHNAAAVVTALGTGSTLSTCATATSVTVSDKTGFSLHSDYDAAKTANSTVPDAAGVVATALGALETHGDSTWATATGFSTHTAANVWAVGTRVLTAGTNLNDPTAAAIADAVWDEAYADHVDAGSFGILIGAAFEEV